MTKVITIQSQGVGATPLVLNVYNGVCHPAGVRILELLIYNIFETLPWMGHIDLNCTLPVFSIRKIYSKIFVTL